MTPDRLKLMLPIFHAYSEGKVIQFRDTTLTTTMDPMGPWTDYNEDNANEVSLNDPKFGWRVKPEKPGPRQFWIVRWKASSDGWEYQDVLDHIPTPEDGYNFVLEIIPCIENLTPPPSASLVPPPPTPPRPQPRPAD
jgi:hypothetical protein